MFPFFLMAGQNAALKNYNSQIAKRMQERDEDWASAYARIDVLEKRFLKAVIAIIALGAVIVVAAAVKVCGIFKILPF
jgi:cell division protein FtsL